MKIHFLKECDGGMGFPISTATNVGGIGNPVMPGTIDGIGSGDRWDNNVFPMSQQAGVKRHKTRKLKRRRKNKISKR